MSDDDSAAVIGDEGGYVPCDEVAGSEPSADDTDAIVGDGAGYVPLIESAAAEEADDDTAAITGRGRGYVALPCNPCTTFDYTDVYDSFDDRTTSTPALGLTSRDGDVWSNVAAAVGGSIEVVGGKAILISPYLNDLNVRTRGRLTTGTFVGGGDWTILIKFMFPHKPIPTEVNTITHAPGHTIEEIILTGDGSTTPTVKFSMPICNMWDGIAPGTLAPGVWYRVKFGWFPTEHKRRLSNAWLDGDPDPGWHEEVSLSPTLDMSTFRFEIGLAAQTIGVPSQPFNAEVRIDWIDDGDGPVCIDP